MLALSKGDPTARNAFLRELLATSESLASFKVSQSENLALGKVTNHGCIAN